MAIELSGRTLGDGAPTFVIAEMAWAHDGSLEHAAAIVDGAAAAKADAINFHLTVVSAYMAPHYGAGPGRVSAGHETTDVFRYLEKANLPLTAIPELATRARQRGLLVSAMCNDAPSCDFAAKDLRPDLLMIHPSSVGEERLVRRIAEIGHPLMLYVGGLRLGEIENAIEWARRSGNERLILQHGFQSYPTPVADSNLRYIATLKRLFGLPVSFTDHTDGDDPMALVVPLLGVVAGANLIEKHLTYDRAAKGEDFESSLNPAEFALLVERIRQTEAALGSGSWRSLSERELKYRDVVRKRAVAATAIASGQKVTLDDIAFRRSDRGLMPEELAQLLGRPATRDLAENDPITADALG
jgi:sialic acid synthase SpsE